MNKKLAIVVLLVLALVLAVGLSACQENGNPLEIPEYVVPTIGATYGQTLADLTLPEGFSWQDALTTSVGEVGSRTFRVTYTPSDAEKYQTVKDIEVTVTVSKGVATPSSIATLSATYGQTLADIALPAGFSWQDDASTSVGAAGEKVFNVTFTPSDAAHYDPVRNIPVTVRVAKATYDLSGVTFEDARFVYDGAEKKILIAGELPEGVTVRYERNALTNAGAVEAVAHFASEDENFEAIADMTATLTIAKATYDMTDVKFLGATYVYDGTVRSLAITGELPEGVTVEYVNNGKANAGVYTIVARFSGDAANYNAIADMTSTLLINKAAYDLSGVTFEDARFVYDGSVKSLAIAGELPEGVTVAYANNDKANAGTYEVTASFSGDANNYETISDLTAVLTIAKATYDMTGVSFSGATYVYDGTVKSLAVEGKLPEGVTVRYANNDKKDAGSYEVVASFVGNENYEAIADMTATLTIGRATCDISGVSFSGASFVYDGSVKSLAVSGEIPAGLTLRYENNGKTDVGVYTVVAHFDADDNHNAVDDLTATLTITKATYDLSGVTFSNTTVAYDGGAKNLSIEGKLPEGVSVSYENNGKVNVGTYEVVARFTGDAKNYETIADLTATLKIIQSDVAGVSFSDATFVYDGKVHSLQAVVPEGVSVTYDNNDQTDAGVYTVTAHFTVDANHNAVQDMTATLTIEKATYDLSGISFKDATYVYDGTAKRLAIEGELPEGIIVEYVNNGKTNVGVYTVTVRLTGDETNYYDLDDLTATLTITKATYDLSGISFKDATYVYDGTAKRLAIEGELPEGIIIEYVNNGKTNVGVYTVTVRLSGDETNYYGLEDLTATLTINKATYDMSGVTFKGFTSVYDGGEVRIRIAGKLPEGVTVTYENDALTNVGSVTAVAHFAGDADNYNAIPDMTATLTIIKATYIMSGVTFESATYVYDGTVRSLVISGALPQGVSVAYENNTLTNVGSLTAVAHFTGDSDNYNEISDMTATLTIEKATYDMGGVSFSGAYENYTGDVYSLAIEGELPEGVTVSYENNDKTNAGEYTVIAHFTGDSENYNAIPDMTAVLSIAKAAPSLFMENATTEYTYDGAAHGITGLTATGEISYDCNSYVHAGVYNVEVTIEENENYISDLFILTLTINKAPLTVTPASFNITYGDAIPTYTATIMGFVGEEDVSVLGGELVLTGTYEVGSNVGNYSITPSGLTSGDYSINFVTGWVGVAKKAVTVRGDYKTIAYGDAAPEYTYTAEGFVLGQGVEVLSDFRLRCDYEVGNLPGEYCIYVIAVANGNYKVTAYNGFLTVTKAAAGVVITSTSEEMSVDFGTEVPDVVYEKASDSDSITIEYKAASAGDDAYSETKPTNAGAYVVRVSAGATDLYFEGSATLAFEIRKIADPEEDNVIPPSERSATYGDLLSSVELPEGWVWNEEEGTLVGDATVGPPATTRLFSAKYVQQNYADIIRNVEVKVYRAEWEAPESTIYVTYAPDKRLKDVPLPAHWRWDDNPNTTVLPAPGASSDYITVRASTDGDANHNSHFGQTVFVCMKKADPVLAFTRDFSKDFDDSRVSVTASDYTVEIPYSDGNETISVMFKPYGYSNSAYTTTAPKDAGSYNVKLSIAATDWHNAAYIEGVFTISKISSEGKCGFSDENYNHRTEFTCIAGAPFYDGKFYYVRSWVFSGVMTGGGLDLYYKPADASDEAYSAELPTEVGDYTLKLVFRESNNYLGSTAYGTLHLVRGVTVWLYQDAAKNVTYSFNALSADKTPLVCYVYEGIREASELEDLDCEIYYMGFEEDFDDTIWVSEERFPEPEEKILFDVDPQTGTVSPFTIGEVVYVYYSKAVTDDNNGNVVFMDQTDVFTHKGDQNTVFRFYGAFYALSEIPASGGELIGRWSQEGEIVQYFNYNYESTDFKTDLDDPEKAVLSRDYGTLAYLLPVDMSTMGFPVLTIGCFLKDGERKACAFVGVIDEESIETASVYDMEGVKYWFYNEDAKTFAMGTSYYWNYSHYFDENGDLQLILDESFSELCYSTYEHGKSNDEWVTANFFLTYRGKDEYAMYVVQSAGLEPMTYAEFRAILHNPNSVQGVDYFVMDWEMKDGKVADHWWLGDNNIELSYYYSWFAYKEGDVNYLLVKETPDSESCVYTYDGSVCTAKQIAHINPNNAAAFGVNLVLLDEFGWDTMGGTVVDLYSREKDSLLCKKGEHELSLWKGESVAIWQDSQNGVTYSFNSFHDKKMSLRAIKRSPFEMCFVYDGIHSMEELEDLDPIASYYVCFEDSTCFFLSETPYGNDALRYFDYDVDNGAVSPFSVGEVCYFVYERFIQLSEEPNGEGSENVVTFSFNRKGEKQIVFGYEGEYSSAADLPERFHLEGTWSMEGSVLTWVGFDDRIAYYQPNEKDPEDLVLRPYFGELCYLLYDPSEDQTLGFFDKFGENAAYSFQGEISEENMDSVTGGGIGKWTYDADAKMLGAGADYYYFRYYFYQDEDGNWNPIVESSEPALTISFYSYEYRYDDNKNSWSTITYLFAKDLETHAQPIYKFVREGILAPLTYAECKAVLEDPNSVNGEDYYHSYEHNWSESGGNFFYSDMGTTFYIGPDFGVSFFDGYVYEEGGVEYLLIRQSYNNFYVYTFEDYTAAQILHMKPDTAMSFLSESNAFVAKSWGERYIRIHNDETDRTDILSITGHTVAPIGIDNLFCSGSFTRSDADGDKDCTVAFCKREEGVIFVFITEGTYGFDELDGLDFEFFGEAYEFPFEENVYSVYADERDYGFELNGTVATYVDLGGEFIIL